MKSAFVTACLLATIAMLSADPALAQSGDASNLSEEELREVFERQKTRGLVLAPTTPTQGDTSTAASTAAASPSTYVELDEADQVNISIEFDFDSAALRSDQTPKLAALCTVMGSMESQLFRIVGHTDASGSATYNDRLSKLRAEEVKRYLVGECNIDPTRLEAVGFGERFPFNKDNPRADENRRVEFQALS